MKLTRLLSLSLMALLSLTLLAGCSSQDADLELPDTQVTAPQTEEDSPLVGLTPAETPQPTPDSQPPVTANSGDIALSVTDLTLFELGEDYQFTISNLLDSDIVSFASDDVAVATVTDDGTVTAVGPGSATITATVVVDGITSVQFNAVVRCDFEMPVTPDVDVPQDDTAADDMTAPDDVPSVEETPDAGDISLDFVAFYEALAADSDYQVGMMLTEGEMLTYSYPTLADYDFAQVAIYMPMMSVVANELALIQVADATDVDAVIALFQARIDAQVDGGAWYPSTIEGWEKNSRIVSNGNFIMLVVAENADDVVAAFNAKF